MIETSLASGPAMAHHLGLESPASVRDPPAKAGQALTPGMFNRQKARAHAKALLKRIEAARKAGKPKKAKHLSCMYLNSRDAHHTAVLETFRKADRYRRPDPELLPSYARGLDPWAGTDELVTLILKEKGTGAGYFRTILDFGFENRALQQLVLPLLEAQANRHPNQYGTRGVHVAIKRVVQLLEEGNVWAIESDIKDCYPSFDSEKVPSFLPLPEEVTRSVVLGASLNLTLGKHSIFGPADEGDDDEVAFPDLFADARRGFPQGSATSPLSVEILLAPIFDQLPEAGEAIGYIDNFLALGKEESDVVSMTQALGSALKSHPAGRLRPKELKIFEPGTPINFLGHRMILGSQGVQIDPDPMNVAKFEFALQQGLSRIKNADAKEQASRARELRRYVSSWAGAFQLCPVAETLKQLWLEQIHKSVKKGLVK